MQNLTLVTQIPTIHGMPRGGGLVGQRGGWAVDYKVIIPTKRSAYEVQVLGDRLAKGVRCALLVTLSCVKFEVTRGF